MPRSTVRALVSPDYVYLVSMTNLGLISTGRGKYHYVRFVDAATESSTSYAVCPRSLSL